MGDLPVVQEDEKAEIERLRRVVDHLTAACLQRAEETEAAKRALTQIAEHAEVPAQEMAYAASVHFDWIARTARAAISVIDHIEEQ